MMELLPELKETYQARLQSAILSESGMPSNDEIPAENGKFNHDPNAASASYNLNRLYPIEDPSEEIKREFLKKLRDSSTTVWMQM